MGCSGHRHGAENADRSGGERKKKQKSETTLPINGSYGNDSPKRAKDGLQFGPLTLQVISGEPISNFAISKKGGTLMDARQIHAAGARVYEIRKSEQMRWVPTSALRRIRLAIVIFAIVGFVPVAGAEEPRLGTGVLIPGVQGLEPTMTLEANTDRPGQNFRVFDLEKADPSFCAQACYEDPKCRSYTYVKPGVQGPKARCWLKSGVPPAKANTCCTSGVKTDQGESASPLEAGKLAIGPTTIEPDTDRPGMNYKIFDLVRNHPKLCQDECLKDPACQAWTYVKPGIQGRSARCCLKYGVPRAVQDRRCISGKKMQGRTAQMKEVVQRLVQTDTPKTGQSIPKMFHPAPTPRLQAFQQQVLKKLHELKVSEQRMRDARLRQVHEDIQSRVSMKSGSAARACSVPTITSVYPTQVNPGCEIVIKGCGFTKQAGVAVMYDPSGKWLRGTMSTGGTAKYGYNAEFVPIDTWSDTEIHGHILRPSLLFEPRNVKIRIKLGNNQWSNPSPNIHLEPNYDYYVCRSIPFCEPLMIDTTSPTNLVIPAPGVTAVVCHLGYGSGVDILTGNMKLTRFFTFAGVSFTLEKYTLTPFGEWQPIEGSIWDFDQCHAEFKDYAWQAFKGKAVLPDLAVKWFIKTKANVGVSYSYAVILKGPEGHGALPLP